MAIKLTKDDLKNPYSFPEGEKVTNYNPDQLNIFSGHQVLDLLNKLVLELEITTLERALVLEDILSRKPFAIVKMKQVEEWIIREYRKKEVFLNILGK
ncbi:MAG: hypothetical protein ACE364_12575 [Chlorobiota bacterium]